MEDDSDIYSDLPVCNFDVEIEKLKTSNKNLSVENAHLQGELVKITKQKDEYQTKCATLTKNISSLLKTAQAEIQRKDQLIKDLRAQLTEVTLETRPYRKRKVEKDLEASEVPRIKRSANGLLQEENSARKDCFSSNGIVCKENGSTASENKSVSTCNDNDMDNSKQDSSAINIESTQRLPFSNVHCKTVYSQRMLNKLQSLSTTNPCSNIESKTNNEKESHNNESRNDFYKPAGVKETAGDNPKRNEEQKFIDSCMKGENGSASPFLVPEVNGINKLNNTVLGTDKKQREANLKRKNIEDASSVRSKQLDALFGSPLKWTESSDETIPQLTLTSPTVYEDSCSAHIENAKFTLDLNKPSLSKPISIHKGPKLKITPINKSACVVQRQEVNENVSEKEKSNTNESKWLRAFENVSDKCMPKPKSVFSALKKDASKCSSISVNISRENSIDIPHNFLLKSKYEDSVLGQFDDTTQFVSALTRVESKISPLNTPVKYSSQPLLNTVNICTPNVNSNLIKDETVSEQLTRTCNSSSSQVTNSNSRPVNKDIHEKPINILQPRKTPRIVSNNKSKASGEKSSATVTENPTKSNRFAINDEFISKQEEKVLKKCLDNVKDPIAISITSKYSHSPNDSKRKERQHISRDDTKPNLLQDSKRKERQQISTDDAKPNLFQDSKRIERQHDAKLNLFQNAKRKERQQISADDAKPNLCQDSKRKERQQISTDDAKPNLCQDSIREKFNVVPNVLEKRISRIQNFKPSSHLKKQADTSLLSNEKCHQNKEKKEIDDDNKSPKSCKSNSGNCLSKNEPPALKTKKVQMTSDNHCKNTTKNLEKLPMIVRSSKKPEFASTTLSDDDYASKTPTKPAETLIKNRNCEVIELMEWVLKPITFHSDHKSVKNPTNVINQRTNKEIQSCSNTSDPKGKPRITYSDSESPKMRNNKTDSFVSYTCPSQIKVVNSAPSPNKVIRGRRPLNFGVSVVTH